MKYLLGIDFGGGSSKATLIDVSGVIIAENTAEYPTIYPFTGACEQNPEDWIGALCVNSRAVLEKSGINPADIMAVAVSSATHTSLLCDKQFRPLRPAVHWTDSRSRQQADRLMNECGDEIFGKCFHYPNTIWTLPQLMWLRENEPQIFSSAAHLFFEKDYIRYFLTGVFCTDYIEAEGSMLFDLNKMQWDKKLCKTAGIDMDILPPVVKPTDVVAGVTPSAAAKTGLLEGTPVICGTTDTVMEVFAGGAVNTGDMTVKLATAGRICIITDKPYPDRHLVNYSHILPGLWYPGTATKAAAAAYRWYRDTFGGDYKELDDGACNIPVGSQGLFFHPYLNGELTPYADPMLCSSFVGIRPCHTKAHFSRSVMEGVAFSLMDSKRYLESLNIKHNESATLIGGGAKSGIWSRITADALGIRLCITESSDSSLGSAMLAGLSCGVFENPQEASEVCVKVKTYVDSNPENTKKYEKLFKEYKSIHDALAPVYRNHITE